MGENGGVSEIRPGQIRGRVRYDFQATSIAERVVNYTNTVADGGRVNSGDGVGRGFFSVLFHDQAIETISLTCTARMCVRIVFLCESF